MSSLLDVKCHIINSGDSDFEVVVVPPENGKKVYGSAPQYVDYVKSLPRPLPLATIAEPTTDEAMDEKQGKNDEIVYCLSNISTLLFMLQSMFKDSEASRYQRYGQFFIFEQEGNSERGSFETNIAETLARIC
nr:hypothetical protein [Tanacetum cinerariifolium]